MRQFLIPFLSYKYLLLQLTQRSIKERYKQSIVGYAWIVINPLIQLLVFSFVFSVLFKFPTGDIPYPIFLLVGLLPWTFFQTSLSTSTTVLVDNANLLKKVYFPREILPYSVIPAKAVDLFFASSLLLLFMFFYKVSPQSTITFIFPIFIIQVILMSGLSLIFSAFNLFYRDIQHLVTLILMTWMYLTPVIYPLSIVPDQYMWLYKLNPMVGIIEGYRSAIFNLPFNSVDLLWSTIISVSIFLIGYLLFKYSEKVFADIV